MPMENGQIVANDGSGISTPAIARTGGAQFNAFTCPPYPKWVETAKGSLLVQNAEEEAAAIKGSAAK